MTVISNSEHATQFDLFRQRSLDGAYDLSTQSRFEREHLTGTLAEVLDREVVRHRQGGKLA